MSIHSSLRVSSAGSGQRNVWTRMERIAALKKTGRWQDGDEVEGLPKVRTHFKAKTKKKEEPAAAELVPGVPGAPVAAGAAAPAAAGAPAKDAKAAGGKDAKAAAGKDAKAAAGKDGKAAAAKDGKAAPGKDAKAAPAKASPQKK